MSKISMKFGVILSIIIITISYLLLHLNGLVDNFNNKDIFFFYIFLSSLCLNIHFVIRWTSKSRYLKNKKALSESKDKYKFLVESLLEGIGIVDENESFTFANKAGNEIFGCEKDKLVDRNLREFTNEDEFNLILEKTSLRKQGKTDIYELDIIGLDKIERTLLVKSSPVIDEQGNYKGAFGLYTDISDQKKHEVKRDKIIKELESKIKKGKHITNGFLPICASCHKIRDEKKIWHPIADYITENTDIKFSHSVCPDCKDDIYGPGKKSKSGRREYNIEYQD